MLVERPETASEPVTEAGRRRPLLLRDVVAPRLKNFGAAAPAGRTAERLNDLTPGHMGGAGLRDLRRDAGLRHPRPRARTEPVNGRGDPGSPKHAPRRVAGQRPAGSRRKYQRRFWGQRPRPFEHAKRARAQRDGELAPGLHPRRGDRPPRRLDADLVPTRPARLSGPHRRQRDHFHAQHRRRVDVPHPGGSPRAPPQPPGAEARDNASVRCRSPSAAPRLSRAARSRRRRPGSPPVSATTFLAAAERRWRADSIRDSALTIGHHHDDLTGPRSAKTSINGRLASRGPVEKSRAPSAHARPNETRCPSSPWRISLRCPPFAR